MHLARGPRESSPDKISWGCKFVDIVPMVCCEPCDHYDDVIMDVMASQITSLTIVNLTLYSGAGQRKHQSSASLAFVRGMHRGPVNSPHKWLVTREMFPFDDISICKSYEVSASATRRHDAISDTKCIAGWGMKFSSAKIRYHKIVTGVIQM